MDRGAVPLINEERRTIPVTKTVLAVLATNVKLRSSFPPAFSKTKIEDFHFHDLRHTFAMKLVQNGIDLHKVQQLLGHKSPIMTQRYAHHFPESLRNGVEILNRVRGISTNLAQSAGL